MKYSKPCSAQRLPPNCTDVEEWRVKAARVANYTPSPSFRFIISVDKIQNWNRKANSSIGIIEEKKWLAQSLTHQAWLPSKDPPARRPLLFPSARLSLLFLWDHRALLVPLARRSLLFPWAQQPLLQPLNCFHLLSQYATRLLIPPPSCVKTAEFNWRGSSSTISRTLISGKVLLLNFARFYFLPLLMLFSYLFLMYGCFQFLVFNIEWRDFSYVFEFNRLRLTCKCVDAANV